MKRMIVASDESDSLYKMLVDAGLDDFIDHDDNGSDMYVRKTPETTTIIKRYCKDTGNSMFGTFIEDIDHVPYYDCPFEYEPYWFERAGRR